MNFSKPVSKIEYLKKCVESIKLVKENDLNVKGAKFDKVSRKIVVNGLKQLYLDGEHRLLFSYSSFDATQDDRIAHHALTIGFASLLTPCFEWLFTLIGKGETSSEICDKELSFDELFYDIMDEAEASKDPLIVESRILSRSIMKIYTDLEPLLPGITDHQKRTLTGYVALRFGLIDLKDQLEYSEDSKNTYLAESVRSIINTNLRTKN